MTCTRPTGKTAVQIACLLTHSNILFVLTSCTSETTARFNWDDSCTLQNPFRAKSLGNEKVSAVYLIPPARADPADAINAFIDDAIKEHNVDRFELVAGSATTAGGNHVGKVWGTYWKWGRISVFSGPVGSRVRRRNIRVQGKEIIALQLINANRKSVR